MLLGSAASVDAVAEPDTMNVVAVAVLLLIVGYLLLELLVELLKLLQLCKLLRVLLQGGLKLRLLGSLPVDLPGGLGLGSLAGRDVGQAATGQGQVVDVLDDRLGGCCCCSLLLLLLITGAGCC